MNAAAAQRLETARASGFARVRKVEVMEMGAMVPSLVRRAFERATEVEVNEYGMAALQPDGSWLWVAAEDQPGGRRV